MNVTESQTPAKVGQIVLVDPRTLVLRSTSAPRLT